MNDNRGCDVRRSSKYSTVHILFVPCPPDWRRRRLLVGRNILLTAKRGKEDAWSQILRYWGKSFISIFVSCNHHKKNDLMWMGSTSQNLWESSWCLGETWQLPKPVFPITCVHHHVSGPVAAVIWLPSSWFWWWQDSSEITGTRVSVGFQLLLFCVSLALLVL